MNKESTPPDNGHTSPPEEQPLTRRALRRARQEAEQQRQERADQSSAQLPPPVPAPVTHKNDDLFDQEQPRPRSRREARVAEQSGSEVATQDTLFDQEQVEEEHQKAQRARKLEQLRQEQEEQFLAAEDERRRHREKDRILRHIREQNAAWALPPVQTQEATPLPDEQIAETEAYQTAAIRIIDSDSTSFGDPHSEFEGYQTIPLETAPKQELLKTRRNKQRKKFIVVSTSIAVFLVAVVAIGLFIQSILGEPSLEDYTGPGGEQIEFTVADGEGAMSISARLVELDVVASNQAFLEALDENSSNRAIQPGDYQMRAQMAATDAVDRLLEEPNKVHYIAIRPGLRISEVFEEMADSTGLELKDIEASAKDLAKFGLPAEAKTLEGYVRPGEYRVPIESTVDAVLQEMTQPTFTALEDLGVTDPAEQFRILTVGSLLVGEAKPEDYPHVAGIIENRLVPGNSQTNGLLQIDATVIYGLGVQRLTFAEGELQDSSNAYNTYVHPGLPPGPIGAPSQLALEAATNPDENDDYYWVTVNIETGETKFAQTLEEHNRHKAEYEAYCEDNPDICAS